MQITKDNFQAQLPQVIEAVKRADFVAIDAEFTGLAAAPWLRASWFDSVDSKWMRIRDSALKMSLLQYGITTFEWDGSCWIARPFAFCVLPRKSHMGGDDGSAGCGGDSYFVGSSDTITFLHENKFDFNAWARDGISFLSREHEARLRDVRRREVMARFAATLEPEPEPAQAGATAGAATTKRVKRPLKIVIHIAPTVAAPAQQGAPALAAATAMDVQASPAATSEVAQVSAGVVAPIVPTPAAASSSSIEEEPERAWDEWTLYRPDEHKQFDLIRKVCEGWLAKLKQWEDKGRTAEAAQALGLALHSFTAQDGTALHFPYMITDAFDGRTRRMAHVHVDWEFGTGPSARVIASTRQMDQKEGQGDWNKRMCWTWVGEGTRGREAYLRADLTRAVREVDDAITRAVGLRKVFDAITEAAVPVVGHNCWLDLAHTSAKFIGPGMSRNIVHWSHQLGHMFPLVYDTKYLIAAGSDPVVTSAFGNRNSLGKAFGVVEAASSKITAFIPAPAPVPVVAAAESGAEAAAPAAPAAATAGKGNGGGKGARGGRGGNTGPRDEKVEIDVDWRAYAPVKLAPGFSYKTTDEPVAGAMEDAPIVVPAPELASSSSEAVPEATTGLTPVLQGPAIQAGLAPPIPAVQASPVTAETGVAHDAGFDSFMTGVVFLRVAGRLLASISAQAEEQAKRRAEGGGLGEEAQLDRHSAAMAAAAATPLPPSVLHDVLQRVASAPAPPLYAAGRTGVYPSTGGGAAGGALLVHSARAVGNLLHNMQAFDRSAAVLSLDHMRALAAAGRACDTKPGVGEPGSPDGPDAGEGSLLLARSRARDKACWIHISGLDHSVKKEDLVGLVAAACGIGAHMIDSHKVAWIDDSSAFLKLPSPFHARDAVAAAQAGPSYNAPADGPHSSSDEEMDVEREHAAQGGREEPGGSLLHVLSALLPGSGGGDNMLGIPGASHSHPLTVSRAGDRRSKPVQHAGGGPSAKRARVEGRASGVANGSSDSAAPETGTCFKSPDGRHLCELSAEEITPELALSFPRTAHLSSFTVRTYREWLALPHVAQVFGSELEWECEEDGPPPGLTAGGAASEGAETAVKPAQTSGERDRSRPGPGAAPGCMIM